MKKTNKRHKGKSVQDLPGIKIFTKNGLNVGKEELIFYMVQPTNISVLSHTNIEIKVRHLMMVLSAVPDIEIPVPIPASASIQTKAISKAELKLNRTQRSEKFSLKTLTFSTVFRPKPQPQGSFYS